VENPEMSGNLIAVGKITGSYQKLLKDQRENLVHKNCLL